MNDDLAGYLQEHKEMRAEIRHYMEWRGKIMQFTLLLTAAAVAVADQVRTGELFLLTTLIVAFLWHDENRHAVAVFRIGTYLEVFVEPHVKGLSSETIGRHHSIQTSVWSVIDKSIGNGLFPALFVLHAYLMVNYGDWTVRQKWVAVSGLMVVFIGISIRSLMILRSGRSRELKKWLDLRERLTTSEPGA